MRARAHLRQAYPQASLIGSYAGFFADCLNITKLFARGVQTREDDTEEDS